MHTSSIIIFVFVLQVHIYNHERSLIYAPGLGSWQQNSEIIHATSTDPEGPYKYRDTVLGHFSHGPTVRKYDDKPTYMMMNLGCGRPFMPFVHGCTNGSTPSNILSSINGHIPHAANESTRSDADERPCQSCPNHCHDSAFEITSLDSFLHDAQS